ncbi:MAG: hypothetical protein HY679_07205 [Chloroflexi bacterium]|nr:hypothetical protein [Chloroflexota bacterium]
MNKKLIVVTVLAVAALVVGSAVFAGQALAQSPTPGAGSGNGYGYGPGMMSGGYGYGGMMSGGYGYGRHRNGGAGLTDAYHSQMHEAMFDALAHGLGISRADLDKRVAAGETPAQIAAAEGLTQDQIAQLFATARTTALDQLVANGALTQDQANAMLTHMGGHGGYGYGDYGNCPAHNGQIAPTP